MNAHGLKRKLANLDSRIAKLYRCIAETRASLEFSPNNISEEALKSYELIKQKYEAERAELVSEIGREMRR